MHEIKLTDGTTTVNLNDGTNVWTTGYSLATPQPGATDVSDSIELLFVVPSATVRSVDAMLDRAAARTRTRRGPRIYVTVKMTADSETWRSELFQGQLLADGLLNDAYIGKVAMTLVLQRAPFWEGAEAEIPLRNYATGAGDPVTGGVTVPNDPEVGSWVGIDATGVTGALPAPVRMRITNLEAGAQYYRYFLIGNNVFSLPLASVSVIQGEDETTGTGADSASAVYSDGNHWTSDSFTTTNELLGKWGLGTGLAQASEGRWWRLIARVSAHTDAHNPVLWPVVYDASGVVALWVGQEVRVVDELLDFGPVPLPPGPWDDDYTSVMIGLWGRATEPTTVAIDYFYLMPMDALRKVEQITLAVAHDDWVEIDEIERRYYAESASGHVAVHVPSEAPLVVWPGVAQRVHLLYQTTSAMTIGDEATVTMWYRPRRLTL